MKSEMITVDEAAKMLDCSVVTVRRRYKSGDLGPVVKQTTKHVRLYRDMVERYIKSKTKKGKA